MNGIKKEFSGKVVLITGSSSGIGAATAIKFAKLGADLSLTGRNTENLNKTAEQCKNEGAANILITPGDLAKKEDIEQILHNTINHFQKLDILVNNAGIYETDTIQTATLEKFDRIFNINLRSIYYLTHLAVPHLTTTEGNIINVSSFSGLRAVPWSLSYSMSKAALDQFTRCIALELAGKKIRVNGVNPGATLTGMQQRNGLNEEQVKKFVEKCKETHPLGRPGLPEEIADAIVFLASEKACFITGVSLPVDGGKHAACPR